MIRIPRLLKEINILDDMGLYHTADIVDQRLVKTAIDYQNLVQSRPDVGQALRNVGQTGLTIPTYGRNPLLTPNGLSSQSEPFIPPDFDSFGCYNITDPQKQKECIINYIKTYKDKYEEQYGSQEAVARQGLLDYVNNWLQTQGILGDTAQSILQQAGV